MLPDWDFNGDEAKRRTFVAWVEAELDRFTMLLTDRYPQPEARSDWTEILAASVSSPRPPHRPPNAFGGLPGMIGEYELLRYMFRRYWPGRKRPTADPASALRIAVNRCRRGLSRAVSDPDRLQSHSTYTDEIVESLQAELKRATPSAGRREAAADIEYLETLPDHKFST